MKCPQGNSCLKLVFLCEAQEVSQAGLHRTLSIRPSICPSNCPSIHPCTIHSSVHPTVHLSIHPSIHSSNRPPMQQTIVPFPSAGRCEWHCILSLIFVAPARWGCHAHSQLRTRGLSSSSHGPLGGHWAHTLPTCTAKSPLLMPPLSPLLSVGEATPSVSRSLPSYFSSTELFVSPVGSPALSSHSAHHHVACP